MVGQWQEKALLEESLAGSGAGWGPTGSQGEHTGSELGGGFGRPSLAPCPRRLKRRDEIITSPTSDLPPSWSLELISAPLSAFTA